jgi:hypothetical protein
MKARIKLREEILEQLKSFGISGKDVYFIDYIPLIEMMWADGMIQPGEQDIFYGFIEKHVAYLNKIAGYEAFTLEAAVQFVSGFLKERPSPAMLKTLRNIAADSFLYHENPEQREQFEKCLLAVCLDIGAASGETEYPSGLQQRFSTDEKRCFFEILDAFENRAVADTGTA